MRNKDIIAALKMRKIIQDAAIRYRKKWMEIMSKNYRSNTKKEDES